MSPTWSAVTKTGLPQTTTKSVATKPVVTKRQPTKAEYAASIVVPHMEALAPSRSVKIGSIDIAIDHNCQVQLPYYAPRDLEFWEAQYKEYRRRKTGEQDDEVVEEPAAPQTPVKAKPVSWAALLRPSPAAAAAAANKKANEIVSSQAAAADGRKFTTLEDVLENWQVEFSAPAVQPRGLVNSGNMCFMNVVLQALLYCEPFCSMLRHIKKSVVFSFNSNTPLLEALIRFVHEFRADRTPLEQLETGLESPFVPEDVYEALQKKNVFQTLRGQQEDAQEFMSYLVDGIHEEMVSVLQAHRARTVPATSTEDSAENGAGWLEVGPNNRAVNMRDVHSEAVRTPITQIFGGALQSTLTVPGATSDGTPRRSNREPFQWLALDVSSDSVSTIGDALDELVAPETIEGYMTVQGQPATATKQMVLERVPPVLVLHLKRFVFCADEGVKKVHKFIEYPAELALAPAWLARSSGTARYRNARFRLTGVIYHHGSHASGGHYTCDIQRPGGEWLQFDDVDIESLESVDAVLKEKSDRTAYILFYTICR